MDKYLQDLQLLSDKVHGVCDESWQEIAEQLRYSYSVDTLRKSANGQYGACAVYEYFMNTQSYAPDKQLEQIESARDELYKERVRLQDKLSEKNKDLREQARYEQLVEVLKEKIDDFEPIVLPERKEYKFLQSKYAVLCLSDWHCGLKTDNQWNFYDVEEMKRRANIIVDKCIQECYDNNVSNLIVEINGDMCEGMINVSNRVESEEDVIQQILIVSEVLSQCIAKLMPHFVTLEVYTTLGNHGRLCANKKDCTTKENFEMLIPAFLKLRLHIPIHTAYGLDFLKYEIKDKTIMLSHGSNDSLSTVISDFSKMYKIVPTECHLAHTHAYKDINDCDCIVNVNGSLVGTDDFALRCRKVTKPAQNLIIYGENRSSYSLIAE